MIFSNSICQRGCDELLCRLSGNETDQRAQMVLRDDPSDLITRAFFAHLPRPLLLYRGHA